MIEIEVHSCLRAFLRQGAIPIWPHHLTMARLVARALRLGRSALIQTAVPLGDTQSPYRLSYLATALIWNKPIIIVAEEAVQQRLLKVEIPQLQQWIYQSKEIQRGDLQKLLLTSPQAWLSDRLKNIPSVPAGIPTIIDGADDLETWVRNQLTVSIQPGDWDELMVKFPQQKKAIIQAKVQLTKVVFQHPNNPYECYLISPAEQQILLRLYQVLENSGSSQLPEAWTKFWQQWQTEQQTNIWASIARSQGQFSLYCSPQEVATALSKIWIQQPVVLIGGMLDVDPQATVYRQQMGLGDITAIKFASDKNSEAIQLYIPDRLPMPNTPEFQEALIKQIHSLLNAWTGFSYPQHIKKSAVILIGDTPLKAQVGAILAAEFGSKVQVEKTNLDDSSILVTGWEFWRQHQPILPTPQLLVISTLPIPSLENPLIAAQVAYYKLRRQDWFRLYLLPAALRELQRAIAPVRESQGIVALFDNRINHRSYGKQVLAALSPLARSNYFDPSWFTTSSSSR